MDMQVKTLVTNVGIILFVLLYIATFYYYLNPELYKSKSYEDGVELTIFVVLLYGSLAILGICCKYICNHWEDEINLNKFK